MSLRSQKRRRHKRGGYLGHLRRIAALFPACVPETKAEKFVATAARVGLVYAHPEDVARVREGFVSLNIEVRGSMLMERGCLVAGPSRTASLWPLPTEYEVP